MDLLEAIVLINAEPFSEKHLVDDLKKLRYVKELNIVYDRTDKQRCGIKSKSWPWAASVNLDP